MTPRIPRPFPALLAAAILAVPAHAAPPPGPPLDPEASRAAIRVPDGFRVDLVAAEPLTTDPVALAWDADGGLWVVEMSDYPLGPPGGRIRRLVDDDGDGRMDRSSVFAEIAPYPDGLMPWRDGLLVTAAPRIWFLRDTDGDGKADVRTALFEGFGEDNPQHNVNGLIWGLDGWIYGASGPACGSVRASGSAGPAVDLRGHDFRIRPDDRVIESVSGHSQYGIAFDDWGRRFTCDNRCHIRLVMLPENYLRRNPRLSAGDVQIPIAEYGPYGARVHPIRDQEERFNSPDQAGQFSSACSVHVHRGGAFPPGYEGSAFTCEPVGNLVHRCVLVPDGPALKAVRGETGAEFLASTDPWFRPVFVTTGPDGGLYVADMYRAVIEHPEWIPKEIQAKIDLRAGSDRGRIYRVVPRDFAPPPPPALAKAPTPELVRTLAHPNAWRRDAAHRLLMERRDAAALPALRALSGHEDPRVRVRALHALDALDGLETSLLRNALSDPHPQVRTHALKLAETRGIGVETISRSILRLASDPDPAVRFQAAFTIGEIPGPAATAALAAIAEADAENRWIRTAVLSSLDGRGEGFLRRLAGSTFLKVSSPGRRQFWREFAAVVGAGEDAEELSALLDASAGVPAPEWLDEALIGLVQGSSRRGVRLADLLARRAERPEIAAAAGRLAKNSLRRATDPAADLSLRLESVQLLGLRPFPDAAPDLEGLLAPFHRPEVQAAAVQAIGRFAEPAVAPLLLARWPSAPPALRREMLDAMLRRKDRAPALAAALERGTVRPSDLDDSFRRRLLDALDGEARARTEKTLGTPPPGARAAAVEAARPALDLPGDPARGRAAFDRICATCHALEGRGAAVGPDLGDVRGRPPASLLEDILDPNRAVDPRYAVWMVRTKSEQTLTGLLASDAPAGLTLRRAGGSEELVPRAEIDAAENTGRSLMPEGLEQGLGPQEIADLLAYLRTR